MMYVIVGMLAAALYGIGAVIVSLERLKSDIAALANQIRSLKGERHHESE